MTVMEYAAKFNELSRFAIHQVNTEERKMDHFEQGLRGDIKSVLAGKPLLTIKRFNNEQSKSLVCWKKPKRRPRPST